MADYRRKDLVGTGRHLTKAQLRAWTRFLDAGRLIEELLAQHVARDHNMTHSDYEVLVRLDGAGGSMRMSNLANDVVSSAQKLTHTANRLEKRGWISRTRADDDGRGLMAALTPAGTAALEAAAVGHAELIKQFLFGPISAEERDVIADSMDRISAHLRLHRTKQACPDCGTEAG